MHIVSVIALAVILTQHKTDAGTAFTRWGRSVCPTGTVTLYKGYMAGPHFNAGGSGSNFLCITQNPKFVRPKAGHQNNGGYIAGVEFDITPQFDGLFSAENIPDGKIVENDMVCVVCYVEGSYSTMVLPGRQDCENSGYDLMYKGFMVSQWNVARGRGEYVCLDEAPEGRVGGTANNDQSMIYPVQVGCGSLPCNPFVEGYELPCAVCTY